MLEVVLGSFFGENGICSLTTGNRLRTKLAAVLSDYQGKHPLVLAIPRGAVPMGRIIADELGGELDVVLVRKLPAPFNPEFAIGSVDESGWTYVSEFGRSGGWYAGIHRAGKAAPAGHDSSSACRIYAAASAHRPGRAYRHRG